MSPINALVRFKNEVLAKGPDATLPANLSDFWLEAISQRFEEHFQNLDQEMESDHDDERESPLSIPLAAVIHILLAKNGGKAVSEPLEQVFDYLQSYRIELALEELKRRTEIQTVPASLETIFTNRAVSVRITDVQDSGPK